MVDSPAPLVTGGAPRVRLPRPPAGLLTDRRVVASLLLATLTAAWFCLEVTLDLGLSWLGWLLCVLAAGVPPFACARAAHSPGIPVGAARFWSTFGLATGLLMLAAGTAAWDSLAGPDAPTQHLSLQTGALAGAGMLVAAWAVLALPGLRESSRRDPWRFRLDVVTVVVTSALFLWHLTFRHLDGWLAGSTSLFALLLVASFVVLGMVKVALTGPGPVDPVALKIVALGYAVGIAHGGGPQLLASRPDLQTGQVGYPLTALLFTLAAQQQYRALRAAKTASVRADRHGVLPYLGVVAAAGLLLGSAVKDGGEILVVAVGVVILTAVVVVRQVAALRENEKLLQKVDAGMATLQETQDQLAYLATHDALTGVTNRHLFEERLGEALGGPAPVHLALIDVDDFKTINDRYGHLAGDRVLGTVAEQLRVCLGPADTAARLGGDEFAVLHVGRTADDVTRVLRRALATLDQAMLAEGHDAVVGVSIGLAESLPGDTAASLMHRADLAMYEAKERGKGRFVSFEPAMERDAEERALIGADLRHALSHDQLRLVYQPIVSLPAGAEVRAVEALVRWRHPERGEIPPGLFVPVAERAGLIAPLGAWILREACRQAAEWDADPSTSPHWRVSVNISALQLREPGFAQTLAECLGVAGLPAARLMIEVTETAVFDNARAVEELRAVSALGVTIALDDFGTGHSSLGLLQNVPVDVLKVDKSFVDGVTSREGDAAIVGALIRITEGMRLEAIAEGVESAAQADQLYWIGYRLAQGYHFARPLEALAVAPLLVAEPADDRAAAELRPHS